METYKLTKKDKIDIVVEALEVLYRELNDYSVCDNFPITDVPHIIESISKAEKLLNLLKSESDIDLLNYIKGEMIKND